jgi:hypothetical protein
MKKIILNFEFSQGVAVGVSYAGQTHRSAPSGGVLKFDVFFSKMRSEMCKIFG